MLDFIFDSFNLFELGRVVFDSLGPTFLTSKSNSGLMKKQFGLTWGLATISLD